MVEVANFGVTVVTGVDAEIMRMMLGRAVLVTDDVGIGGLTDLVDRRVEHRTTVDVDTPAVTVNVALKT